MASLPLGGEATQRLLGPLRKIVYGSCFYQARAIDGSALTIFYIGTSRERMSDHALPLLQISNYLDMRTALFTTLKVVLYPSQEQITKGLTMPVKVGPSQ